MSLSTTGLSAELTALPFALSLFVAGMPHGAADGAALRAAAAERPPGWGLCAAAAYLAVDGLALCVLLLTPAAALVAFLPLTVWHFGRTAMEREPAAPRPRLFAVHTLVIGLPFAFRPAATLTLFDDLVRLAGGSAGFPRAAVPVAALCCVAAGAWLLFDLIREPTGRGRHALLLAALVVCPLLFPPLASVGVLFLFLHAGPECVFLGRRLSPPGTGAWGSFLRLHRLALPLWLPVLAAVAWLWPHGREALPAAGPVRLLALWTLLACCALTPAHELLRAALARARKPSLNPAGGAAGGSARRRPPARRPPPSTPSPSSARPW